MRRIALAFVLSVLSASCAGMGGIASPGLEALETEPPPRPWTVSTQAVVDQLRSGLDCASIDPRAFRPSGLEIGFLDYHEHNRQGRTQYAVLRDYSFVVHLPRSGARPEQYVFIRVPRGFITDMYSVPDHLRPLVDRADRYSQASVLHDWLYAVGKGGDKPGRRFADDILYHAMLQLRAPEGLAERVHVGVTQGGAEGYGSKYELRFYDSDPDVRVSYLPASQPTRDALRAASTCVYPAGQAVAAAGAHAG
jgi:hypothetical protein